MNAQMFFITLYFSAFESIKITYQDQFYKITDLKGLNFYYNPQFDNSKYQTGINYIKKFPFSNPVFVKSPDKSVNISTTFGDSCLLPIMCIKEQMDTKIIFQKDGSIIMKCDQTNFDLFGLKNSSSTQSQIFIQNEDLINQNLQVWQLKKKLKRTKNYHFAFFCLHFKNKQQQTLSLKLKFLSKSVTTSQYVEKLKHYREEILQENFSIKIYEQKQKQIRFKDNFQQIKIVLPNNFAYEQLVFATYNIKKVQKFKIFTDNETVFYDVQNFVLKFVNISENIKQFDVSVNGLVSKPTGYQYEESEEINNFDLIITLLIFLSVWVLNSYDIFTFWNVILLSKMLFQYIKKRIFIKQSAKQNKSKSVTEFQSPEKIFSKRTIESNNKLLATEMRELEIEMQEDESYSSCCQSDSEELDSIDNENDIVQEQSFEQKLSEFCPQQLF